ncbi:MAG: hypothetical protein JNM56_23335 [Planctomycetia bacterium]|nr:hypothetical protein [Planctomycetia bacterium]
MGRVTRFLQATSHPAAEPSRDPQRAPSDRPDEGLERVIAQWPHLPKYIQRAILTLVSASRPSRG